MNFSPAPPKWQARDDVYQVGQLLAMLVKGNAALESGPLTCALTCSDHLKEIIYRCIGERRKRYEGADELIEALRTPPASLKVGVRRSLKGVHMTFTGILSKRRSEAAAAAKAALSSTAGHRLRPQSWFVDGPTRCKPAGRDGGLKLMDIKRLRAKGHKITLINESQFWRLVKLQGADPLTRFTQGV